MRRASPLNVRHDVLPEGAGIGSSTVETTDAHLEVHVGGKRERSNQVAIDDNVAATGSTDRHIPDNPSEGASKRLKVVADALLGRARLWLAYPEGLFPARDGPAVLDKITDELLVVASDVTTSAAANADESVSGKARLRMLAWLVADARGAAEWGVDAGLDKAAAETVGKRLDRQAQKVRAELDNARAAAAADRARATAACAGDDFLAVIDSTEQQAIARARNEVYVGYHELESLMPRSEPEVLEPELAPAPAPAQPAPPPATEDVNDTIFKLHEALEAKGIRCPVHLISYQQDDEACPPDLVALIGSEAVQEIKDRVCSRSIRLTSGKLWWDFALPQYVRFLRDDRARLQQDHAADLELEVQRRSEAEARSAERAREMYEQNGEMDELRDALERAKGREEALHTVIQRCRWA